MVAKRILISAGLFFLLFAPAFLLCFFAFTVFHQMILLGAVLIAGWSAFYVTRLQAERDRLNREVFLQAYELKKVNDTLESCLATDTKTQVYHERLLHARLTEERNRANRYRRPLSCLLVAVDRLDELVGQYGGALAQVIVQEVADFLKEGTRSVDVIVRQGEDRFVAILPETQRDQARIVAERIRATVERNTFNIEGKTIQVTVTVAVISFDPSIHQGKDDLLQALEKTLWEARKGGTNRIGVLAGDQGVSL